MSPTAESLQKNAAPEAEAAPELVQRSADGPARSAAIGGLTVGAADDPAEAAADAMADTALDRLRRSTGGVAEQHQHGAGCEHVRRSPGTPSGGAAVGFAGGALDQDHSGSINARRGKGSALPGEVRGRMETAFGRSFSDVRIHTDSAAAGLSRSVSAAAFTTGKDVFFGAGQFQPGTPGGEKMLAHELAHVVQGDGAVHRDFIESVKNVFKANPEKVAKREAAKILEQQKKADKKAQQDKDAKAKADQQAIDKASAKKAKADEGAHKQLEKDTATAQKADRAKGQESRSATSEKILKDPKESLRIQAEFADALAREKQLFNALVALGAEDEEARDEAYKDTWISGVSVTPELNGIRPPRETAAERMTSDVRKQRTDDAVEGMTEKATALGSMLSKKVERVYEQAEEKYEELKAAHPDYKEPMLRMLVERTIWAHVPEEILANRPPKGGAVDKKAKNDARERLNLRGEAAPAAIVPDDLETGISVGETAGGVAGGIDGAGQLAGGILKKVGKPKDKAMGEASGKEQDGGGSFAEQIPGLSVVKKSRLASERVADGKKKDEVDVDPKSDETKAASGIGAVTGILTGLIGMAQNIMLAVKAINKAKQERSLSNIAAATKASTDAVNAAANTAKSAANFAGIFSDDITRAVATFIPGLNIGISALDLISNGANLVGVAVKMNNINNQVFDARTRKPGGSEPEVLVYPLLKVQATFTKKTEEAAWNTGISVSNLSTSIATVASAGGFGIPAAVQSGVKLLDLLHKLGHFIADNVLARIVAESRSAAAGALEGSAEKQLTVDPAMAIDSLVMAAKKGDPLAIQFVQGFGVTEDEVKDERMTTIRAKVLKEIGEDADPLTAYAKFKNTAGAVKDAVSGIGSKWAQAKEMATDRNGADGGDRGFGWRVKMMLKGEMKFNRSLKKTEAVTGPKPVAVTQDVTPYCRIGALVLPEEYTDAERDAFCLAVESTPVERITAALKDKYNQDDEVQQMLLLFIQEKNTQASKVGSGK